MYKTSTNNTTLQSSAIYRYKLSISYINKIICDLINVPVHHYMYLLTSMEGMVKMLFKISHLCCCFNNRRKLTNCMQDKSAVFYASRTVKIYSQNLLNVDLILIFPNLFSFWYYYGTHSPERE